MKRSMNARIMGMVLATSLFLALPVYAGEEDGNKSEERGAKMMEKMTADLGLSQEQQDQMKAMREANKERSKALKDKIRGIREAMKTEINKLDTDMAKVNAYVEQLAALYKEKMNQRIEGILGMKKVLTPEQFGKLNAKMEEKRKEWQKKSKHGDEHAGPGAE